MKHGAFLPAPDGATSVFRIRGLGGREIWNLGSLYVGKPRNKRIGGRADVIAKRVSEADLQLEPDEPPPRHASILGWPDDKGKRMQLAQQLAESASLKLCQDDG